MPKRTHVHEALRSHRNSAIGLAEPYSASDLEVGRRNGHHRVGAARYFSLGDRVQVYWEAEKTMFSGVVVHILREDAPACTDEADDGSWLLPSPHRVGCCPLQPLRLPLHSADCAHC